MIKFHMCTVLLLSCIITGCDSLSRWKMAGTRTLVSFVPREVDQHIGELAARGQNPLNSAEPVPGDAQRYIAELAAPIVKVVDVHPLTPQIRVASSKVPNAYAFPHGGIFVTTGLLKLSKTPEEILAVLAHELAHVVGRHSMQQMISQAGTTLVVNLIFGDLGALADLAGTGGHLLGLKFSRDHEREADGLGAEILRKAELPLQGMSLFFERMQEFEKSQSTLAAGNQLSSILSTHPATQERIEAAQALKSDLEGRVPQAQTDAYQALKKMF